MAKQTDINYWLTSAQKDWDVMEYLLKGKKYVHAIKNYSMTWPEQIEKEGKLVYSPFEYDYILCKTNGMGAFLRLIREVFPKYKNLEGEALNNALDNLFL